METIKNNMDKYQAYKTQIAKYNRAIEDKYNRAIEEGFYYEATLISYAIMEDRMLAFLDKIGFVNITTTPKKVELSTTEAVRPFLRSLVGEKNIDVRNISAKRRLIASIITMRYEEAEQYEKDYAAKQKTSNMNGYLQELYMDIDESGIDREETLEILTKIADWCDRRNSLIHSMLNIKTGDTFDDEVETLAKESVILWRFLDNKLVVKLNNCKLREKYSIV